MFNTISFILIYIVLLTISFYKSKLFSTGKYNYDFLEKNNTDSLKGLAMLGVLLHHLAQRIPDSLIMKPFHPVGAISVGLFFLFSGYGLLYSKLKRNSLENFIQKRLTKVIIPFVSLNILTILLYSFIFEESCYFKDFIKYALGIKLIDPVSWYILVLLMFYFAFYILFSKLDDKLSIKLLFILSSLYILIGYNLNFGKWWYETSLCFPIGTCLILYKNQILNLLKNNYLKILLILLILIITNKILLDPNTSDIGAIINATIFPLLIICILFKIHISNRILQFLGSISFEMYLIHNKVYEVYFNFFNVNNGLNIILSILITILLAFLFNRLSRLINYLKFNKGRI